MPKSRTSVASRLASLFHTETLLGGVRIETILSYLCSMIRGASSVMALDLEGRVLGVRIGHVIKRFTFEQRESENKICCCFLAKFTFMAAFTFVDNVCSGLIMVPGWKSGSWAFLHCSPSSCQRYGVCRMSFLVLLDQTKLT